MEILKASKLFWRNLILVGLILIRISNRNLFLVDDHWAHFYYNFILYIEYPLNRKKKFK